MKSNGRSHLRWGRAHVARVAHVKSNGRSSIEAAGAEEVMLVEVKK